MDPKQLNQLDPKLKATYDRVMGTTVVMPKTPNQTLPVNPTPPHPQTPVPKTQVSPFEALKSQPAPKPFEPAINPIPSTSKPQAPSLKPKNKLIPIFVVFGGIIFIAAYTVFWVKLFNLKLPFLPF